MSQPSALFSISRTYPRQHRSIPYFVTSIQMHFAHLVSGYRVPLQRRQLALQDILDRKTLAGS